MLNDVELCELAAVVRRDELAELLVRLASQVRPVDEEQDPVGLGELREPVDRIAGRERLAGAGRHLDE